jgi:hypothetical protein
MGGSEGSRQPGAGVVFLVIALFVIVGFPLVYEIWETVNLVLIGEPGRAHLLPFLGAVLGFAVVVYVLAHVVRRWLPED